MRKSYPYLIIILFCVIYCCTQPLVGEDLSQWNEQFRTALQSGRIDEIRGFFEQSFSESELDSWKYRVQRGFLDFKSALLIPLSEDAVLVHIATDSSPYSGENFDKYFDFIYRIYRIKPIPQSSASGSSTNFAVTERCMDDFNPDFLTCTEILELFPSTQSMTVDCEIKTDLKSNILIFKLAKEFQLDSLTINGKEHPFRRFGYFIYAKVDAPNPVIFRLKGTITAVSDHNQFFCIDDMNFFLRSGGFAAEPSPPPDNQGRPYFSSDQVEFNRVIRFPSNYKLLVYGDIIKDDILAGKRSVTVHLTEKYLDGLSFYAQTDWNIKTIQRGNLKAGFYFPLNAGKEQEFLENEIQSLLVWLYRIFKKDPGSDFAINFVVLDKFVEEGLLNDSKSIIASKASIIGSEGSGYIHELCHNAPQPQIEGNILWIKEGFTNYLAFNFLRDIKGETDFWALQKRAYLHRFGLYCEPLGAIIDKGIPCYWSVYQKGPWIYRMLETGIGKENFDKTMTVFGQMEGEPIADTIQYFKIMEKISGKDLSIFRTQWLERKLNPVLRVHHKVAAPGKNRGDSMLTVHISQEKPIFHFPLDIEIKTEKQTIRRTLLLDAPEKSISIPINCPLEAIRYDPDDRVFAHIRDGRSSFIDPALIRIPLRDAHYRFESDKDKHIVEFEIKTGHRRIDLYHRDGEDESHLELSPELSPKQYDQNNAAVYSVDTTAGKINFPEASYDISEPVYPHQFPLILFSMVDWEKTRESSLVYLYNSGYSSSVISAKKEQGPESFTVIRLKGFALPIQLYLSNGIPVKYIKGDGDDRETFTRINE